MMEEETNRERERRVKKATYACERDDRKSL